MKVAVCYFSKCHGNTLKLIGHMVRGTDAVLLDVGKVKEADLTEFDVIGFASGIYFGKFHHAVIDFAVRNLPRGKKIFFVFTGGAPQKRNTVSIENAVSEKKPEILGQFRCRGYDTYGPFRLVGGIAKGHPNEKELNKGRDFYRKTVLGLE